MVAAEGRGERPGLAVADASRDLGDWEVGGWEGDQPLAHAEIGVAQAGRPDPDEDLAADRTVDLDLLEDDRLVV